MNSSNDIRFNISCEDLKTVGFPIKDVYLEDVIRYMTIGSVSLLLPISVCMNLIVIILIAKFKHLRQTTYFLALQLIIIDLVYTCTNSLVSIISAIARQWILGLGLCQFTGNFFDVLIFLRSSLMFVFVCDRFCCVFIPFDYPRIRKKVIIFLIVGLLLNGALIVVPYVYDCIIFSRFAWYCFNTTRGCFNEKVCSPFLIALSVFRYSMGSVLPLIMYIILFIKARQIRQRTAIPVAVMSGYILERKTRERKANYTFLTLFLLTFCVTSLTLFHFLVIRPISIISEANSEILNQLFIFVLRVYYNLLPILDSIAIMRNSDFHCVLRKMKETIRNRLFGF